ncbi:uncharacterized protein LOC128825332 [Malaclemys terrapin pileata]|uniref:uncharacterized protein LOC128825332 n=1 Tax=Malaclemys terrapin pileata TaxID=2991368 RepID=UPI0023A7C898|nr:uncharacterized protein LOC128825332 [Malaclemys terrapin pileata]XP_053863732.1 uncharacterized protein LOC128825332 [Malaclemys terrapin pileata]
MAAEKPRVHKIQLQQKYWLKNTSKAKLLQLGAICMDTVTDQEHYYDTTLHELAQAQTWLYQKNQQWYLLVDSQKQETRDNATTFELLSPEIRNPPHLNKTETSQNVQLNTHSYTKNFPEKKPTGLEHTTKQGDLHFYSNKAAQANVYMEPSSIYTELVIEREIIAYLAHFFHINLTEDERSMTMKDFLRLVGIQHYASNHTTKQVTYTLYGIYTIIIQRDERIPKESSIILVDTDILNVARGFERIEKLANELEFQQQTP